MSVDLPTVAPPFVCIFCGAGGPFNSQEHIVPHSLGNDLLVLAKGWVCDSCNTTFSGFESRVLYSSILGAERCRMGVMTKRNRPAHSKTHGVSWFAQPTSSPNVVTAEAAWDKVPLLVSDDGTRGRLVVPLHDETNADIGRFLLKIGIEILSPLLKNGGERSSYDLQQAKKYLVTGAGEPWPYFLLRDRNATAHLVSVFDASPQDHEYVNLCGFDIFLHEIDDQPIVFLGYGAFFGALCLTSRDTGWRDVLVQWGASHVGCPSEYAQLCG